MLTTVKDGIKRSAIFDATGQYRYSLERRWPEKSSPEKLSLEKSSTDERKVVFIMLNPSRADAKQDDPTLRACMQFARIWGYSVLEVVNLFAYCTADPKVLKTVQEPIGEECDRALLAAAESATQIILAWGNWGQLLQRDQTVLKLLANCAPKMYCLGMTQAGQPRHPLYIKRTTSPIRFE
ncbi:MAG: DUF1643 domain-containing protein [Cyanobacteria bacterium P01_A01_bin.114]